MDFIEGLPHSTQKICYYLGIGSAIKVCPLCSFITPTTFLVAQVFVKKLAHLHWMPRKIVRDSDKVFLSQCLARIFPSQGTQLCLSNPYQPWSNGQTEVVHRCSETYLPSVKDIYILQELNPNNGPSGFYEPSGGTTPHSKQKYKLHPSRYYTGTHLPL